MDTGELIGKVRKIEIKAKGRSQDMFSGAYHSAFKGRGMHFSESRTYQYGDDIRDIDWNVTARTGEAHVKVYEEERELTIMLLIDISASQLFGSQILKRDIMAEIAAVLAFNALNNHDKVGAVLFSKDSDLYIPPGKGNKHVLRIIREIVNAENAHKGTDINTALTFFASIQKKRSICFLLSDFMNEGYEDMIGLVGKKHDLIPVRIFDPYEKELPALGLIFAKDEESGRGVWIDSSDKNVNNKWADQNRKLGAHFSQTMRKQGIKTIELETGGDYIRDFLKFFKTR
ncbi:MAG: DUF58 domain-containing protein [Saprospiraceae bacterium]|nr:DUF58 domain-containing protein [Saprospiraceae bacterium]